MAAGSIYGHYLDLKRVYRKNMAIGFGISAAMHLTILGVIFIFVAIGSGKQIEAPQIVINSTADLIMPPSLSQQQEQIRVVTPAKQIRPSVGTPEPVPDGEAPDEVHIATQEELANMAPISPATDLENVGVDVDVVKVINELLPSPDEFIPYEEPPIQVKTVNPAYPPLAQRAGIEGVVWLNALVDKDGKVRDVRIVKNSGANAGFEEAAVEAAYRCIWRPAIANGQPLAVWVTYRVGFALKGQ